MDLSRVTINRLGSLLIRRLLSSLVYSEYGHPPDVVRQTDVSDKILSSGEILIQMKYCPINPSDINTIQGTYPIKPELPAVAGGEGVGVVLKMDENASVDIKLGDWLLPKRPMSGTWRSHMIGTPNDFIKIRNDINIVSASTLAVNPCTAYRLLSNDFVPDLSVGDVVIQNGANSGVGQAVIQLAKRRGLTSVNIVRERAGINILKDGLMKLGANYVWTVEEFRKAMTLFQTGVIPRPRLALNCVGGSTSTELAKTLSDGGCHVTYGGMGLKPVIVSTSNLIFRNINIRGFWLTRWINNENNAIYRREMYDNLTQMMLDGSLLPPKHVIMGAGRIKEALDLSMQGLRDQGKVVLDMTSWN